MSKCLSAAVAATLALATGACQPADCPADEHDQRQLPIYIGALTCNVSGGSGYLFGSTKDLSCVFLNKDGASQLYDGKIRKFGIDVGYTKAGHMIWHVYVAGLVGNRRAPNPTSIAGNYGGEQGSVAAGSSAGGNWLYGGSQQPGRAAGDPAAGIDERRLQPGARHRRNVADPSRN